MGRFAFRGSAATLILGLLGCSLLTSCSSSSPTTVAKDVIPAIVKLTPAPNASLEVGKTLLLSASAENGQGTAVAETFSFQSSAPNIVTVANNGLACAGSWDSITTPTQCTPGGTGVALVTAVANGVPSPPVTVYVHQHVTNVIIQQVPGQPATISTICFSKGAPAGPESTLYEAFAFNGGSDITASVGPFTWKNFQLAESSSSAVTLQSVPVTAPLNQEIAQANSPGSTFIFASAGGVNSQPLPFTTCPVQTVSIFAQNFPTSQNSFVIGSGTSITLNAVVKDSIGMTLTGIPLTWTSSNHTSVTVTSATSTLYGSTATVSSSLVGSASVTASCTPPSCNGGITPSMPIYPAQSLQYPAQAMTFQVTQNGTTTTSTSPTVFVTSTGCRTTPTTCDTQIVPITRSSSGAPFTVGTPVALPFPPNSALFDPSGTNEYLGVDSTALSTKSAMVVAGGTTASSLGGVAGKILAISPDGSTAIFSDTVDTPQQILICLSCATSSRTITHLLLCDLTNTTCSAAAAFSPDNLKAYIVSGDPCPGTASKGCLLIYSRLDATQYVQLGAPATDVAFIGNGTLGYLAGGDPAGAAFLPTCVRPNSTGLPANSGISAAAQFLLPLPDGLSVLALSPPNLETITANIVQTVSGPPAVGLSGCPLPPPSMPPPVSVLSISNAVNSAGNLGAGPFTPSQFFLSPDGTMAYILGAPSLPVIIQVNLTTSIPFEISLTGNATPLSASLSPDGSLLFVGATDSTVHVISTSSLADIQQVTFPFPQNSMCIGPGTPVTQVQTSLSITSAAQNGSATTYTYNSLTGPALQTGETILITGMTTFGNNGRFAITALGSGTFTVTNANGVTASSQIGTGISGTICTPDLVAAKP